MKSEAYPYDEMAALPSNPKMHLALIGGTGFVGSAIINQATRNDGDKIVLRALVRGHEKRISASAVTVIQGELPEMIPPSFFPEEPHVVLFFATKQIDTDKRGFRENERNIEALLNQLPGSSCGVIYGSSMSVYGQGIQNGVTEEAPLCPDTPLSKSRRAVERLIIQEMQVKKRGATILRPRFILGETDRFTLPAWIKMVENGTILGNGHQNFSIVDVDDYASIILKLASSMLKRREYSPPLAQTFNVGYSRPISLNEIVEIICKERTLSKPSRSLPILPPLLKLCRYLPVQPVRQAIARLELGGLSHFGDTRALEAEIGTDILQKSPEEVLRSILLKMNLSVIRKNFSL